MADQIQLRKVLVDADGIEGAHHGDAAGEPDALGLAGDRGEHDGGRGDGELVAVMLAQREHVEAELVGGACVGERRVEPVERRDRPTRVRVGREVAERDDAEFDAG